MAGSALEKQPESLLLLVSPSAGQNGRKEQTGVFLLAGPSGDAPLSADVGISCAAKSVRLLCTFNCKCTVDNLHIDGKQLCMVDTQTIPYLFSMGQFFLTPFICHACFCVHAVPRRISYDLDRRFVDSNRMAAMLCS